MSIDPIRYRPKNRPGSGPSEPSGNRRLGRVAAAFQLLTPALPDSFVNSPAGAFSSTCRNSSAVRIAGYGHIADEP